MAIQHQGVAVMEKKLQTVMDKIDDHLEEVYGQEFRLHPSRPARGEAASGEYDGLFSVTATFSPGYGSSQGSGYVLKVRMVTLESIPQEFKLKIEQEVATRLTEALPEAFPERKLQVAYDNGVYKVHGDLSIK